MTYAAVLKYNDDDFHKTEVHNPRVKMKRANLYAVVLHYRRQEILICLLFVLSFLDNAYTQKYHTDALDEVRNVLLSYSSGSSKPGGAKPREPSNSFLKTVDQIEKSVYEAQAMKIYYNHSPARLRKITDYIKLAHQQGNSRLVQQLLGHGLYTTMEIGKSNETTPHRRGSSRRKRCPACASAVKSYMDTILREVGRKKFDELMAVKEEVTLAFAIDDTGSMATEIEAAKAIAKYIINTPRQNMNVDYVLSPFNDPKTGPITKTPVGRGKDFIAAIEGLTPNGGRDCPELAFKGIIDAINSGIKEGSPLYVFTDATAKDSHQLDMARVLAKTMRSSVYFFTTGLCGFSKYKPYEDLAKATCGQVFELPKSGSDFSKIKKISKNLLGGTTCVGSSSAGGGTTGRRKRRGPFTVYKIPLDDSMNRVIISVTTQNGGQTINLQDPVGVPVSTEGRTDLAKGAIFMVDHPKPGIWKLFVSFGAGEHSYVVKGSSATNLDFDFAFVLPRNARSPLPIPHPLIGKSAHIILTVSAANKIYGASLQLEILNRDNEVLNTTDVHSLPGKSGAHFSASFSTPTVPFKLKLRGQTKRGFDFERNSPALVQPSRVLLRVLYSREDFTVPISGRGLVIFIAYNTGSTENFQFQVKDSTTFNSSVSLSSRRVFQNRIGFFYAWFTAKAAATRGSVDTVMVTATGETSKTRVSSVVSLMAV